MQIEWGKGENGKIEKRCGECKEKLEGIGSYPNPYKCKCGIWKWKDGNSLELKYDEGLPF